MAALGHTVDPGSGASGNYASMNALNVAQAQDLTDGGGDTYTATCTTTGDNAADTVAIQFNGWETAAVSYFSIEAAIGDEAVKNGIDATRFRFEFTNAIGLRFEESFMRINGIQAQSTITADNGGHLLYQIAAGVGAIIRVSNCYFKGIGAGTGFNRAIRTDNSNITMTVWNTIITGFFSAGNPGDDWCGIYTQDGTINVYNCVIHGCSYGIREIGGTINVINCAVFKNDDDFVSTPTIISYCASDDNDTTDGTNVTESGGGVEWPDDFVDAANGDFTLLVGSGLKDTGINDPGSGLFSVDIDGDTYVIDSWPVGVDQFMAVGGAALSLPIAMAYYSRIRRTSGD